MYAVARAHGWRFVRYSLLKKISLNLVRVSYEYIRICYDDVGRSAHISIAPVHMAMAG